jgi:ferredoxin-NADP reductase/MOSC domain-containing protein YiiM
MGSVISVNVGLPKDIEWQGRTVHTGIWKTPVSGRVMARRLNIDGDGQGDLGGHGGEQRAVFVYQLDSYLYWEEFFKRKDFTYGQFGENLTIEGLPDNEVCIGDRYRIGHALFEVTQPRVTCYRVGIRMGNPQMAALLVSHQRPGFYFRVIEEGEIGAGDEIIKVGSGPEQVTVTDINALLYLPGHPRDKIKSALRIPSLSPGWKVSLKALLAADERGAHSGNAGLASSSAAPPAWVGFRKLRVAEIKRESLNVKSFVFESEDRTALPAALPGQFLVFKLHPDPKAPPVMRSYSMSGPQNIGKYRVSVKRETGPGSTYMHDHVQVGDMLEVSASRGSFTLAANDRPVVLMSAGIGATPVLAMLYSLTSTPSNSREIWWLYGARNGSEHPFANEAHDLLSKLPKSHSYISYSKPAHDDRIGEQYNGVGHLGLAAVKQVRVPQEADFYLCGPNEFLDDVSAELKSWGVPPSCIHMEIFGTGPSLTPGIASISTKAPHPPVGPPGSGPKVTFTRSGLTVPWDPKFNSILELAEACDVPVKWSCRTGVCHTCESGLIEGQLLYSPEPLDPPAAGNCLICCSKPKSSKSPGSPESGIELDL